MEREFLMEKKALPERVPTYKEAEKTILEQIRRYTPSTGMKYASE